MEARKKEAKEEMEEEETEKEEKEAALAPSNAMLHLQER